MHFRGTDFSVHLDEYLSEHEVLFRTSMDDWRCGLPLGNGDLTATSFEPGCLAWNVGKVDLWDLRFDRDRYPLTHHDQVRAWADARDQKALEKADLFEAQAQTGPPIESLPGEAELPRFACPPQPKRAGEIRLRAVSVISEETFIEKRLSLRHAHVHAKLQEDQKEVGVESYVHAQDNVLVIHGDFEDDTVRWIEIDRPVDTHAPARVQVIDNAPYHGIDCTLQDGTRYVFLATTDAHVKRSASHPNGLGFSFSAKTFSIYATVEVSSSSEPGNLVDIARDKLDRCRTTPRQELKQSHDSWWEDFWSRSFIDISDKMLENLWYFHLYTLAASSRSSVPPAILGPWYCDDYQPWHGDYHGNVNAQMTYWPIYTSNHVELGAPYFQLLHEQLADAKRDAKEIYGMRGAKYPTATYPGGKELSSLWFRYEMHANAWSAQTFWWHWHYTRNRNFLKETGYEVIREVTAFFLNYLVEEDDGHLSIYPTMSPEQGDWMIRNPTIDLALVRELFEAFLETSAVLNRDQELRDQCHTALSRLSAYPRNDSILLDYDDARPNLPLCHAALLAPVYPGSEVSPDSSDQELFGLASRTLDGILERTARSIPNFPIDMKTWNDDMTWPWLACIAARMQRPDLCLAYLRDLGLLVHLKPNGFFTVVAFAPGFQDKYLGLDPVRMEPMLNSGPGLVAAINEMLLQSFDGRIRLFPAVPDDWDVRFAQLRAVGGFLVSAERHGGKVEYCIIESECGQTCCVANPWPDQDVVVTELSSTSETVVPAETPELAFDTETSCVYRIEPKGHTRPKTPQMLTATQRPAPRIHKGPGDLGSNHEREKHQVTLGL